MNAGYSQTPQARNLGLKSGQRVALDASPTGWSLTNPPELTYIAGDDPADLIVAFFTEAQQLGRRLPALGQRIFPSGILWIAWPRRAGGHESDITDNLIRSKILEMGLVDTKVAAIDEDWSGQKVVWRLSNRDSDFHISR
jgi:hypothetical protein